MMMTEPVINGNRLKDLNAEMVKYEVGPAETDETYMLPAARVIPMALSARVRLRPVSITLDFLGKPKYTALAISELTASLMKEVHLELPDGFLYWGGLTKISTPKEKAPWIQQVQFTFACFRHLDMETFPVFSSGTVYINGNVKTPIIVELTPAEGETEATINGVTVKEMAGPVTINGVDTTVLDASGTNWFRHTNLTKWIELEPGHVPIELSEGATAKISYYPIFL